MIMRLALTLALIAAPAMAEDAPRSLRLVGSAPIGEGGAAQRFAIDALIEDGDGPLQTRVEGWLAGIDPVADGAPAVMGEVEGACVDDRCALSAGLGERKLLLSGDLTKPGASTGKVVLQDSADKVVAEGPASFTPFADTLPGVGRLVAVGAVTGQDLAEPLLWAGFPTGYANTDDDPPAEYERKAFAAWQAAKGRHPTGLFTVDDLAALRAEAAAAKTAAGWTPLPLSGGWKAGYPAAMLRSLSVASTPSERRYASDDGKASLLTRTDAPMDDDAWDAFIKAETSTADGRETHGYMRVNDDFELNYTRGDRTTAAYYFNGDKGLRRMEFSYPTADDERWSRWSEILRYAYRAGEAER